MCQDDWTYHADTTAAGATQFQRPLQATANTSPRLTLAVMAIRATGTGCGPRRLSEREVGDDECACSRGRRVVPGATAPGEAEPRERIGRHDLRSNEHRRRPGHRRNRRPREDDHRRQDHASGVELVLIDRERCRADRQGHDRQRAQQRPGRCRPLRFDGDEEEEEIATESEIGSAP